MSRWLVDTPEGPAVLIGAGRAASLAAALGRMLDAQSPEQRDPELILARKMFLAIERQHLERPTSAHGTSSEPIRFDVCTPMEAGRVLGISARAVTNRCQLGQMPGARQIGGRWLIPRQVLPEREEDDDDQAA